METELRDDMLERQTREIASALTERYRHIAQTSMADVPICNSALGVTATGFRPYLGMAIGVVTTPWFMNVIAVALPDTELDYVTPGKSARYVLPAGEVEFIVGELEDVGRVDSCSLFSPVFEFSTMEDAVEVAEEIMRSFFDEAALVPPPPPPSKPSRRDLLRGKFTKKPEEEEA